MELFLFAKQIGPHYVMNISYIFISIFIFCTFLNCKNHKSTTSVNYQQTSNTTLSNAREQMTETLQAPL